MHREPAAPRTRRLWHRLRRRLPRPRLAPDPRRRARRARERPPPRRGRRRPAHGRRRRRAAADSRRARARAVVRARPGVPPRRERPRRDRGGLRARKGSRRPAGGAFPSCRRRSARRRARRCRGRAARAPAAARTRPRDAAELRAFRARGRAARVAGAYVASMSFRSVPTRRSARPTSSGVLPRPSRRRARGAVRDLPPALLDEHEPVLGARPAVPPPLPQRRDQRDRRQRAGDARPRPRRRRARRGRLGLGAARQRASSCSSAAAATSATPSRCCCRGRGRRTRSSTRRLRAFHRYHAGLVEPWDGPAAVVFTDGRVVGAALDRNGLRPLRVATTGGFVACASEAGAIPLAADCTRSARTASGRESCSPSTQGSGSSSTRAITRRLARKRPVRPVARFGEAHRAAGRAGRGARSRPDRPPGSPPATRARTSRCCCARARRMVTSRPRPWATTPRCRRSPAATAPSSPTSASASRR